jgi:F-type H+-transporting ATPase subunit b
MELGMKTSRIGGLVALLLALPQALWAQGGGEGTTPLFTVNLGTTVWTGIVFVALLLILWRFAWGPILSAVEAREKGIQSKLDEAATRNEEASHLLAEHKAQMADARRQASELIAEGKAAGERLRQEIEEKARTEAQAIIERARSEIERERDAAIQALRQESVDLALAGASRLLQEKLDQEKDRQLVEGYLSDLVTGSA